MFGEDETARYNVPVSASGLITSSLHHQTAATRRVAPVDMFTPIHRMRAPMFYGIKQHPRESLHPAIAINTQSECALRGEFVLPVACELDVRAHMN